MLKIMFVCLGNICRSPMAEAVMFDKIKNYGLQNEISVASSGTSFEEAGNPVHPKSVRTMQRHNVPVLAHYSMGLRKNDYADYDMFIGMEEQNLRAMTRIFGGDKKNKINRLLDFSDNPRDIEDPWYTGDYEKAYEDIEAGCFALMEWIKAQINTL